MKKVKRNLSILLAVMMLVPGAAYAAKDEIVVKIGVLEASGLESMHDGAHDEHLRSNNSVAETEWIYYNNLPSAIMDLESGKIQGVGVEEYTAYYVAARNENIIIVDDAANDAVKTHFSMMTMNSNKEAYDILNNAIVEMKADGTLDSMIENDLKAYINSDPEVKELPRFDGAVTIRVGVTGDLPPMDYVAANGKAAGFNVALLAEIANRAQVNIEFVQIEAGARAIALASGKVDAVFWTKNVNCAVCNGDWSEVVEGTLVTESYFSARTHVIAKPIK